MNYNEEQIKELRERIVTEAHKLLRTPFTHMGVTRFGVDCKGCAWLVYHRAGINDIPQGDGKIYSPTWFFFADKDRYLDGLLKYFEFTDKPQPGDLVVFNKIQCNLVSHGGILIGNNNFIHARSGKCVEVQKLDHRYWKRKIFGFLIYKGFIIK